MIKTGTDNVLVMLIMDLVYAHVCKVHNWC